MKELSIEEKVKRYDEAIERAESLYKVSEPMSGCNVIIETLFPELKESEDEKVRKKMIAFFKGQIPFTSEVDNKKFVDWLEKQDEQKPNPCDGCINRKGCINCENGELRETEQKPADKVEPKFKVGDWIIDIQGVSVNQIIGYEDDSYHIKTSCSQFYLPMKLTEKNYRLWTIQDAKDGDVLMANAPFIFNGNLEGGIGCPGAHCGINTLGKFQIPEDKKHWTGHTTTPATKEQRDTLFKAMRDAGYTFDFEKKELKKVEDKHTCELDNSYTCIAFPFKARVKSSGTIVTIHGGRLSPDGKEWVEYQSDAEDGYKIYEPNSLELVCEIDQNPAWSEEDEKFFKTALWHISNSISNGNSTDIDCDTTDWLKSLKERI